MKEASAVAALANLLYDFLPGSGNNMTAFPLAAQKVGVAEFWTLPGSPAAAASPAPAAPSAPDRACFKPCAGEQIDGSFELDNETYLLKAKWKNEQTPAADLHVFVGKLASRPTWSRGLFISYSGFSVPGLDAFHQGRSSIICMDGFGMTSLWRPHLRSYSSPRHL